MKKQLRGWSGSKADWITNGVVVGMVAVMIGVILMIGNTLDSRSLNAQDSISNQNRIIEHNMYEDADINESTESGQLVAVNQNDSEESNAATTEPPSGSVADQADDSTATGSETTSSEPSAAVGGTTAGTSVTVPTTTPIPSPTPTTVVAGNTYVNPTPTPTPTSAPQATATPTSEPTPIEVSVERTTFEIGLLPDSSATRSARGSASLTAIKNLNGYWDFEVSASFSNLQPNRNYQLWLCGINCSSQGGAKFTTNDGGAGSVNTLINHAQGNDPMNRVMIWEMPEPGEIIDDSTTCYFHGNSSSGCLKGAVSW